MTDWTAITGITGIVVSGVVGPTVAARWAASNQAKAAENAIALADRAAARTMLNGAALAVREAIGRADALWEALGTWGYKLGTEGGIEEITAFHDAGHAADLLGPGVRMMFGDGRPVADAYTECLQRIDRIELGASMIRDMRVGDRDFSMWSDAVIGGLKEAKDAHRRLLEAGHEAIGVRA